MSIKKFHVEHTCPGCHSPLQWAVELTEGPGGKKPGPTEEDVTVCAHCGQVIEWVMDPGHKLKAQAASLEELAKAMDPKDFGQVLLAKAMVKVMMDKRKSRNKDWTSFAA